MGKLSVHDWLLGWEVIRLAEVRLQEGESLRMPFVLSKRKVQQETSSRRSGGTPFTFNRREEASERSLGAKACSKKESKRID